MDSLRSYPLYWPEATNLDIQERASYEFTDRFPSPDWFQVDANGKQGSSVSDETGSPLFE